MADPTHSLVIEALNRAAADPGGLPLLSSKGTAGLFAGTAAARQAAQLCKDQGLLHVARTETRGKSQLEICVITDKGLSFLLENLHPRGVLEAMLRALDARHADQVELLDRTRQTQACLEALQANVARVLAQMQAADPSRNGVGHAGANAQAGVLEHLARWRDSGCLEDCPLPELFHQLGNTNATLTIGKFHDALRELHAQERIFLHPWTGPLYELPEPALALLAGHEIAYYASLRQRGASLQLARPEQPAEFSGHVGNLPHNITTIPASARGS